MSEPRLAFVVLGYWDFNPVCQDMPLLFENHRILSCSRAAVVGYCGISATPFDAGGH